MKLGQFISYYKRKIVVKNYTKTASWKLVPDPFVLAKNIKQNLYWKMKFSKQATYIKYVIAKL